MNFFSSFLNHFVRKKFISLLLFSLTIGCYSFRGGTLPEHLKTISFTPIVDNSNYGNPLYKDMLLDELVRQFRNDNTLKIVETSGDAKLSLMINSIRDETAFVKPGELEKERKITMELGCEFYDAVKKKTVWKKNFSNYSIYSVQGIPSTRDNAIKEVISKLTNDILLAIVSGW